VLVAKRVPRRHRPRVDAIGLTVDDVYVFGSGMDYRGYWRELRGIYAAPDGTT
jgi:hypoxanthine phosphoribosyltransferase